MVREYDMERKCRDLQVFFKPCSSDVQARCYRPIVGLVEPSSSWSSYRTLIREAHGNQLVAATPKPLPAGYRIATDEERRSMGLYASALKERFCMSDAHIVRAMAHGAIDAAHAVDYAKARGWCITLGEVKKMPLGACLEVALMDRNWMDVACTESREPKRATILLAPTRITFCKGDQGAASGTFTSSHKDGGTFGGRMTTDLHVEYAPHQYYPLRGDVLPANDEQTGRALLGKAVSTSDLPDGMLVGWRGPMIRWAQLEDMPELFCL